MTIIFFLKTITVLMTNTLRKAKMRLTSWRPRLCCNIVFRLRKSGRQLFCTPAIWSFICFLFMGWKARKATHLMYFINILKLPCNYLSFYDPCNVFNPQFAEWTADSADEELITKFPKNQKSNFHEEAQQKGVMEWIDLQCIWYRRKTREVINIDRKTRF